MFGATVTLDSRTAYTGVAVGSLSDDDPPSTPLGLIWLPRSQLSPCDEVGAMNNRLSPCPDTPNCVSSGSEDVRHRIEPFRYRGSGEKAFQRLKQVILSLPRTRLIEEDGNYLHFEFRSLLFGFVDDVEFYRRDGDDEIDVRSASRTGYWDLGVNRRRVEGIRAAFEPASRTAVPPRRG